MTYQGQTTGSSNTTLKILVIGMIIWVAYWASTGGIDRIPLNETAATTTSTSITTTSTTVGE